MSSNNIEQFDLMEVYHEGESECEMRTKPHGEYVRYSDHQRIVKELEARVQRLMTTREQAERFIRHHLHSAEWQGEQLIVTFEQEALIAALLGDVEAPEPSLPDVISVVEEMRDEYNQRTRSYPVNSHMRDEMNARTVALGEALTRLRSLSPGVVGGTGDVIAGVVAALHENMQFYDAAGNPSNGSVLDEVESTLKVFLTETMHRAATEQSTGREK